MMIQYRRQLVLLVLACALMLKANAAPAQTTAPATHPHAALNPVSGKVVTPVGAPVPNARVVFSSWDQGRAPVVTQSDAAGAFTLDTGSGPNGQLLVTADGWGLSNSNMAQRAGGGYEVKMRPACDVTVMLVGDDGKP